MLNPCPAGGTTLSAENLAFKLFESNRVYFVTKRTEGIAAWRFPLIGLASERKGEN
jgi:hypothetical protein